MYTQALGCSSVRLNSSSRARGFLALSPWNSCLSEQDLVPPPLHQWLGENTYLMVMVRRIWRLVDSAGAVDHVFGRELLDILLKDIFFTNDPEQDIREMFRATATVPKNPDHDFKMEQTYEALVDDILLHGKHFHRTGVFTRALEVVRVFKKDPRTLLIAGLAELRPEFFPHLTYYSSRRSKVVSWNKPTWRVVFPQGGGSGHQGQVGR